MKLLICFALSALSLIGQQAPASHPPAVPETKPEDLCAIEGQVTNAVTGAPIGKADISLHGAQRAAPGTAPDGYETATDAGANSRSRTSSPEGTGCSPVETDSSGRNMGPGELIVPAQTFPCTLART